MTRVKPTVKRQTRNQAIVETYSLAIITLRLSLKISNFEVFDQNIGFHRFITWETLSYHKTFKLSCFSTFTAGLTINWFIDSVKI